jgi:FeS assembly SUF system protein
MKDESAELEGVRLKGEPDEKAAFEMSSIETSLLEGEIVETIKTVYDPEIPVNIYELGLIYGVDVTPEGVAHIQMTLTSPACPAAQSLPGEVEMKVRDIDGIEDVNLEIVWDPPWHMEMMSEEAKLELGLF